MVSSAPVRALHLSLIQRLALLYGRSVLIKLMVWCLVGMLAGSLVVHLVERETDGYKTVGDTVTNIFILFISGYDADKPQTLVGRVASFGVLLLGICFAGMFTGEIAAWLVERRMKGNTGMKPVDVSGHVIITRWSKDTDAIIDELMSDDIKDKRPVVVIDRDIHELPLTNPLVHFVHGDPTESATLERAGVRRAHTAIILADATNKDYNAEDSRNILVCLAIESLNQGVYTVVQILNPENQVHLQRVHCDEVVCTTEVATRLVVHSSINHGISRFFGEVLSFDEGSEIYRVKAAKRFVGKEYFELGVELMQKHRISLIALESNGSMVVSPDKEARVKDGDHLFVLAPEHPRHIED
jgi:voltage-gated potassium channel